MVSMRLCYLSFSFFLFYFFQVAKGQSSRKRCSRIRNRKPQKRNCFFILLPGSYSPYNSERGSEASFLSDKQQDVLWWCWIQTPWTCRINFKGKENFGISEKGIELCPKLVVISGRRKNVTSLVAIVYITQLLVERKTPRFCWRGEGPLLSRNAPQVIML